MFLIWAREASFESWYGLELMRLSSRLTKVPGGDAVSTTGSFAAIMFLSIQRVRVESVYVGEV